MNSLERVTTTLAFGAADRVPVIAQVFGHAAVVAGVGLGDYLRDGRLLARSQIRALERYGYDAVFALMDTSVETEAAGSKLKFSPNDYPVVSSYALEDYRDIGNLTLPDPHRSGRMPELLEAAGILRREVGETTLVVGCVLGPMTIATQLMGLEKALYLAIDEPEEFSALLDFSTELATDFGKAQLEAGAHLTVVFDPSASPAVIPPAFFREFELPRLARLFSALKGSGAAANWLHIAGPAGPILPLYPEAGVDIANFDYCVSAADARTALPATCLDGNIRPLDFIESAPEQITRESLILIEQFSRGGFILSSGCEIPPESRPENVAAMVAAARSFADRKE
jgi:uroporphyrinogen decarboxylase